MINRFLIIIFISNAYLSSGQTQIRGIVKDSISSKILPYAAIGKEGSSFGTISNDEGFFFIMIKKDRTELLVSYIGYESKHIIVNLNDTFITILLKPKTETLSEFSVTALSNMDMSQIITNINRSVNKKQRMVQSKSFLRYYTYQNDTIPKELLEGYFNTKSNITGIKSLKLKAGKIIIPKKRNYFLSLDIISNLLKEVNFFNDKNSNYFQLSPLYNKRAKKNNTIFSFTNSNLNDSSSIITYNSDSLNCKGKIIYNKYTFQLSKIELTKKYYNNFPIKSINNEKNIDSLVLKIIVKYNVLDGNTYIGYFAGSLEFNYISLDRKEINKIKSSFILKQYDINNKFQLPIYSSVQREKTDYEKILLIPYNQEFWKKEFVFEKTRKEKQFYSSLLNQDYYLNQTPFIAWDIERINSNWSLNWNFIDSIISVINSEEVDLSKLGDFRGINTQSNNKFIKSSYNIETTFLCNYTIYDDTILFDTESFIDYKNSYFSLRRDKVSEIFVKSICYQTKLNSELLLNSLKSTNLLDFKLENNILSIINEYEIKQKKDINSLLKKITIKTDNEGHNYVIITKEDLIYMKKIISKGEK